MRKEWRSYIVLGVLCLAWLAIGYGLGHRYARPRYNACLIQTRTDGTLWIPGCAVIK